jgi:Zn-dependent protease
MSTLEALSIWILPLLFAITLHEVAHGWMARYLGDPTAQQQGRLSLNPIKHIDPVGTILVPLILFFLGGFVFGWAKPVPVNISRLNSPKRDMAVVAVAGPAANFLMAVLWALIAKLGTGLYPSYEWIAIPLISMGQVGISINLILMILNLLPVPPLDGGRVLAGVLPDKLAFGLIRVEPFGLFIVLGLLVFGLLGQILLPPYLALSGMFVDVFALPFGT